MNDLGNLRKLSRVIVIRSDAGDGKTTLATHFAYQSYLIEGTHVFANYHFNEGHIENFTYMSGKEILKRPKELYNGILIIDEISKIGSARKHASVVNQQLLELISERRKLKLDIIVIGQASSMFDKQLREQSTHFVIVKQNPDNPEEFGFTVQDLKDPDYDTQEPRVINVGKFNAKYMWDLELFDTEEVIEQVYEPKKKKKTKDEEVNDGEEETNE